MKIRIGFVSNSSSASFCVAKVLFSPELLKEFEEYMLDLVSEDGELSEIRDHEEYDIYENKHYISGSGSIHVQVYYTEWLKNHNIPYLYMD